jgi:hypothetical protein
MAIFREESGAMPCPAGVLASGRTVEVLQIYLLSLAPHAIVVDSVDARKYSFIIEG